MVRGSCATAVVCALIVELDGRVDAVFGGALAHGGELNGEQIGGVLASVLLQRLLRDDGRIVNRHELSKIKDDTTNGGV